MASNVTRRRQSRQQHTVLFDDDEHLNVLMPDFGGRGAVQCNHHLIVHKGSGMLLDPGGHKPYARLLAAVQDLCTLDTIILSHEDPDIVAALNGWLLMTDATAYTSALWMRFIPHFGLNHLVEHRLLPVADEGGWLELGGAPICLVPAHFMHSCGNFHVYDPIARILYTGDLGASLETPYNVVDNFDAHLQYMEGFHRRYMGGRTILQAWAKMAKKMDIETIAPQHGAVFTGTKMVNRFIEWVGNLPCGSDLWVNRLRVPDLRVKVPSPPRRRAR